jgi:hypothetical protein
MFLLRSSGLSECLKPSEQYSNLVPGFSFGDGQAPRGKRSICRRKMTIWFQLAKVRVTTITIQREQQLAVGRCGNRRQESNR